MRFLLSGGGTAGHVYPALTVAEELRAGGRDEVLFVGTPEGLEARLATEAGVAFMPLAARGFDRSRPLTLLTSSFTIAASTLRARALLREYSPDAVLGFGGYVSIPVGLAAVTARVPLVLHEQNAVPGLANRQLSRWAREVAVTYPESAAMLHRPDRATLTGNPVRGDVLNADRLEGRATLGLPTDSTVLLVFGGSRGARHLNSAVVGLRERLVAIPGVHIIQIAGPAEVETVRGMLDAAGGDADGRWRVLDYVEDMGSALAAADLVLARAGATSLAEITALGRPSVLVPYPYATDDHQTKNAASLAKAGAAVVIADADLDAPGFGETLLGLLGNSAARDTMAAASAALKHPDAAARVAGIARAVAERASARGGR